MRLVKIIHNRCDETQGYTLAWAPNEWEQEQFVDAVFAAEKAYLAVLDAFKEAEPPNDYRPSAQPNFKAYPSMTVAAVQAEWEAKRAVYDAWRAEQEAFKRPFVFYLEQQGLTALWEHDPDLTTEVYWGHRHGTSIDYSATVTW